MSNARRFSEKHAGKWARRAAKRNGSRKQCPTGFKFVAYCFACPPQAGPTSVMPGQRVASCRAGHTFTLVRGPGIPSSG